MKYITSLILLTVFTICCENAMEASHTEVDEFAEAKTLYASNCASCHGQKVEMFVDRKWKHGNATDSIISSIKTGYEDLGMPSFQMSRSVNWQPSLKMELIIEIRILLIISLIQILYLRWMALNSNWS